MGTKSSPEANPPQNTVALIAGPTASGKSDLAVALALALEKQGKQAEIINADSAQVYADLLVLSARPSTEDMQGIPHHLFGAWDGSDACSAADWADAAKTCIADCHKRGVIPILVGGTGLYIRTLLEGIAPIPEIDPKLREEVRAMDIARAYAALEQEDPQRAAMLAPADAQRICRALEVVRSTGKPLAHWQENKTGGIGDAITLAPLVLLPDREMVYAKCDNRFEWMLEHGALEEVQALLARNLSTELPVMRAIGVPELTGLLRGETSRAEAITQGQQATRNYAKRQFTWLRHQCPPDWPREQPENVEIDEKFEILFL